jgi:RHS repeat-associated protein
MHSTRLAITRGLAAFTAVVFVFTLHPAYSSPGDIFSIPAPAIGADPPKAAELKAGDATVSTQTGAMQYSYSIAGPPGRNGMAPSLALSYSSQGPTYGGVAAGWSLPIPMISEDKSRGRLESRSPEVELAQAIALIDPRNDDRFVSSLAGGRELVAITEPIAVASDVFKTYRAQSDSTWARYERMKPTAGYRWRVRTTDGVVMTFGDPIRAAGCPVSDQFAPLTATVDAFGNEVSYEYKWTTGECMIDRITYGQNVVTGLPAFARIDISSTTATPCNGIPVGSQIDRRIGATSAGGTPIATGANRITKISAFAFTPGTTNVEHTREITLGYDAASEVCSTTTQHAPVRLLTSIQESAWGATSEVPRVDLPAVLFTYNERTIARTTPTASAGPPWGNGSTEWPTTNLGWGYRRGDDRWPSVEMMFQDIDGDGRQDLVMNRSVVTVGNEKTITACRAAWRRNISTNGVISFEGTERPLELPRLKWKGAGTASAGSPTAKLAGPELEGCSLNGQATAFENSQQATGICHNNNSCAPSADPQNNQRPYCYPGGTECTPGEGGNALGGIYRTYLAYRWLDVDSDGLVDLVAAVHGDIDTYDIELGNRLNEFGQVRPPEPSISGLPGTGNPNVLWPACPGTEVERCHDFGNCLVERGATSCANGLCTIDWSVFNTCAQLPETPTTGCQHVMAKTVSGVDNIPPPSNLSTRGPYMRCEGLYPWFIYKNTGGAFATTPIIKYQPVPLESANGDSNFSGPSIAGQDHAIMDFDGDGFLDAIARDVNAQIEWQVWLGDGTGGFRPRAFRFPTRPINCSDLPQDGCIDKPGDNAISGTGGLWGGTIGATRGTMDLDGDGLPDHWRLDDDENPPHNNNVDIAFNDGARFRLTGPQYPPIGEVTTPANVRPGDDQLVYVSSPTPPIGNQQILAGDTRAKMRVTDVDNDGRPDLVVWDGMGDGTTPPGAPVSTAKVHYNLGGNFLPHGPAYPGNAQGGVRRRATAGTTGNIGESLTWKLDADMIDLDGDGIEEALWFTPAGFFAAVPTTTQPLRLLKTIKNQRGAETEITYADMHDTSVVEQSDAQAWWDGRKKLSPRTQWVVSQMKRTEQFSSAPPAYTAYKYRHPRFSRGDHSWGFRGFAEVITTNPGPTGLADGSGSKTVQRYDYFVDWSGRLVETLVQPGTADGTPVAGETRSLERTTWKDRTLFGGALTTFHVIGTEKLVCANGQTDPALGLANPCSPTAAPGYIKTTAGQSTLPDTPTIPNDDMMWVDTSSYVQSGTAVANGDRETLTTYMLSVSDVRYFLKPEFTTRNHRVAGAMVLYGKNRSEWNPDYGTHLSEETWVTSDPSPSTHLIERWVYDNTTGNVVEHWKPKQNAAGTTKTTFAHDTRKLFVATETNELGHQVESLYEYGTGALLLTQGPNSRTCTVGAPDCPPGANHPVKEQHKVRVDGLGRMIERWETVSPDGYVFTLHQAEANSYDDTSAPMDPASTTNLLAVDESEVPVKWRQEKTELDGRGRPIRKIVAHQGSAAADHVTAFAYRADGTLQSVAVPDPTLDGTSLVTYTYTFDSLGRAKSIRRPDSTSNPSGVDITYNGATSTTTEVVGAALGQIGETQTINDRYGRLWQVKEKTSGSTYATTTYLYDPDDNVASITDPANVLTTLVHDFAGRRVQITRGTRTWSYGYDKNGNMTSEKVPGSTGPLTDPNYINTTFYDDLDRPASKTHGRRTLTDPELALFIASSETFTYDIGYIGSLRHWRAYGGLPGAEWGTDTYYDGQGRETIVAQSQGMAGFPAQTRTFQRGYNINGTVRYVRPFDFFGGANETIWVNRYDARNYPSKIQLQSPQSIDIAVQTRNVAGLVKKRRTDLTGAMTHIESNWSYDKLGRVADQQVLRKLAADPTTSQVARQTLTYFGNDDVKTLQHQLFGLTSRTFTYGYDRRHQITSTTTNTTNSSYFRATYQYGTAGRFAGVHHERTISPTPANAEPRLVRNVNYVYSGTDPEQVTSLTNVSGGGTFASYTYDAAGNQVTRSYPSTNELFEYTYDGQDQLRRVVRKLSGSVTGSEEYWYDANGQRTIIVKRNAAGTKTGMVWFVGDVEAHYNDVGAATKIYSHLSLGTPVARVERTGNTTTSMEFQFHGLANNTLAAVAQSGTINASFTYAPFGERLESTDGGAPQNAGLAAHKRRSNDKYEDDLSALAYYGARYYDKTLIGWTQSDPLFRFAPDSAWRNPRKASLYTFSLNNSLRYLDPDGREPDPAGFRTDHLAATGTPLTDAEALAMTEKFAGMVVDGAIDAVAGVAMDLYELGKSAAEGDLKGVGLSMAALVVPGLGARTLKNFSPKVKADGIGVGHDIPVNTKDLTSPKKYETSNANLERMKEGKAPLDGDGTPVELHHDGQKPDSKLVEMSRDEHRGAGNFKKNHENTGGEPSKIDRAKFAKERQEYWKEQAEKAGKIE